MLTGKQKRYLRGLGHGLKPVLQIGKNAVNPAITAEADAALATHELIKVRILESCEMDRHEVAEALAIASGGDVAQVLGRTLLIYRRSDEPKIELPSGPDKK
jgi:RNA-binding protein